MPHAPNLVIGAGLAGLSAAYHLGHENTVILEAGERPYGLVGSWEENGYTWDQGPHVSFTSLDYVKELFAASTEGRFAELHPKVGNRHGAHWIDHPAQTSLYQVPEPLRSACLHDFLENSKRPGAETPGSYREWLESAFGRVFTNEFPARYTRKYWTVEPEAMSVAWVGSRVFRPSVEDVIRGAEGPLEKNHHYIKTVRYPLRGGYETFAHGLADGANIRLRTRVSKVDLENKRVETANGEAWTYERLVSTMPLPRLVEICVQSTDAMRAASAGLACSEALLVNIEAHHPCRRPESWLYVYDENQLSTRINFTDRLSPHNAPAGHCGIQVEVYAGPEKPFPLPDDEIGRHVLRELEKMGLLDDAADPRVRIHTKRLPYANVIFLKDTAARLETIWRGFETYGLSRESDDTHPMTDWNRKTGACGHLVMAGRFGQWKYFWSDDCVMRGRFIGGEFAS